MDTNSAKYLSLCALIAFIFSFSGIHFLNKSNLSKTVPPFIFSLFKHLFPISLLHSSTYSLVFVPHLRVYTHEYFIWISSVFLPLFLNSFPLRFLPPFPYLYTIINLLCLLLSAPDVDGSSDSAGALVLAFPTIVFFVWQIEKTVIWIWLLFIFFFNFLIGVIVTGNLTDCGEFRLLVHSITVVYAFCLGWNTGISPIPVVLIGFFSAAIRAAMYGHKDFDNWLAVESSMFWKLKDLMGSKREVVEYAVGLLGTALFQWFFKTTTFLEVLAFLCLTVAWLANQALLSDTRDLGVFNFLLSNVIVGCTVSQFGLHLTTWLAYSVCLLLFLVRRKLKQWIVSENEPNIPVVPNVVRDNTMELEMLPVVKAHSTVLRQTSLPVCIQP